jgi:hypothetical protein
MPFLSDCVDCVNRTKADVCKDCVVVCSKYGKQPVDVRGYIV